MSILHASKGPDGVLLLTFTGEISSAGETKQLQEDIATVSETIRGLHKSQGQPIKILIDISNFKARVIAEAIDDLIGLAKDDKVYVAKTATFGGSIQLRT